MSEFSTMKIRATKFYVAIDVSVIVCYTSCIVKATLS